MYWFGPVSAFRPYLLLKAVLLLVATTAWGSLAQGWRYGAGGFNLSHFAWLDAFQPVPTPSLYVAIHLVEGGLAMFCFLTTPSPAILALLALLYTYAWMMSIFDSFQHHYLVSLLLLLGVFFPRLTADDLQTATTVTGRAITTSVSSWAFTLGGVTVGVVYFFAALSKTDQEWRRGAVLWVLLQGLLKLISSDRPPQVTLERLTGVVGMSGDTALTVFAHCIVALEVLLAASYIASGPLNRRRKSGRFMLFPALLAVAFHATIEVCIQFQRITAGAFSYYMILLAICYLMPGKPVWLLTRVFTWPARMCRPARKVLDSISPVWSWLLALAVSALVSLVCIDVCLPGSRAFAASAALFCIVVAAWSRSSGERATQVLALAVVTAIMSVQLRTTSQRLRYYKDLAISLTIEEQFGAARAAKDAGNRCP